MSSKSLFLALTRHSLLTQSDAAHEIPPALFSIRQEGQDTFPHAGVTVKVLVLELLSLPNHR
jgi:hypothetical protein